MYYDFPLNITEDLTTAQSIILFICIKKAYKVFFSRMTVTSVKYELFMQVLCCAIKVVSLLKF